MIPNFMKLPPRREDMKEHLDGHASDDRVKMILCEDKSIAFFILSIPHTPEEPIGAAYYNEKTKNWYATMGFLWVGRYKTIEAARENIEVAYFG